MAEKVSILFATPIHKQDNHLVEMTRQGIDTQTYPTTLTEVIEIQYVPSSPGAHAAALNAAKEAATGAYIVHSALGVQWDTSKLERQVFHLEANPELAGSVHLLTLHSESGQNQKHTCETMKNYGAKIGGFLEPPWAPGTTMLTREISDQLGGHRNIQQTLWEYDLRQIERKATPQILEEDLAIWRSDASRAKNSLCAAGVKHKFLKSYLDKTDTGVLFSDHHLASNIHGDLIRNALYQKNDDLDAAHQICQSIAQSVGFPEICYWHAIIHRRQPDFNNARGWFQKALSLPANESLHRATYNLLQRAIQMPDYGNARDIALQFLRHLQSHGTWDALYFLNLCESCSRSKDPDLEKLLEDIQEIEFQTFFQWTFQSAIGAN